MKFPKKAARKTALSGCLIAVLTLAALTLASMPPANAQTAAAQPKEKPIEAPGAEYTEPDPSAAPAPAPAPVARSAPPPAAVVQPAPAAQSAPVAQPAPAAAASPTSAAVAAGISAPLIQSAPGTRGALLQEHQMEQLRAILAPVPARPKDIIQDQTKYIVDEYKDTTVENLARMYWAVGKFQEDDDTAIDNYLLITECKLYQQYYENDFEWKDIRNATRQFLHQNLSKMPVRFEAVIPIELDRYDIDSSRFLLKTDSVKESLLRIALETNWSGEPICGVTGDIQGYPRNIIIRLNRPFSLKSFPTDPRIAELYITQTRLDYQNSIKATPYKRTAYLRFKLRMMQYKDDSEVTAGSSYAVIYAALEGWDIYADENETKPMYSYTFPKGYLPKAVGFGDSTQKKPAENTYMAH